jgi:hypothetical protein
MKKFLQMVVAAVAVVSMSVTPVLVHAQEVEEVEADPTSLPSTGGSDVAAPDTGIAPSNRVAENSAVFIGGSILGAGVGLGIVALRKKKFNQ